MMNQIKIGLLPLYVKLYDDMDPSLRERQMPFLRGAQALLQAQGFTVEAAPVCCLAAEFAAAAVRFESQGVQAVVCLHLAYSPSLEAVQALAGLRVPIILLDTTPNWDFSAALAAAPGEAIDANHGIHGVQDLCCVLRRRGIPYHLVCGHLSQPETACRLAGLCRAAAAAGALRRARVGLVGQPFSGMGDFQVSSAELATVTGARVIRLTAETACRCLAKVSEADINAELAADRMRFDIDVRAAENYREATRAGLALRRWFAEDGLSACAFNFMAAVKALGLPKMPFPELCKAMARGMGYAGEGDTLTAALAGALAGVWPQSTFTEMFCPDWAGERLFLSHMAEMNPAVAAATPLLCDLPFPYADTGDTVGLFSHMRAGKGVLVNLAPLRPGRYTLLLAKVEALTPGVPGDALRRQTAGWVRPALPLAKFLEWYSTAGGTHHAVMLYDAKIAELAAFGKMMGFEVIALA